MLLAMAVMLFATATIHIDTGHLGDGLRETRSEGSRRVTVEKSDGKTIVRVEEGPRVDTVVLSSQEGQLTIEHSANSVPRRTFALDRPAVIVDGIDLEPWLSGAQGTTSMKPQPRRERTEVESWPQYYVCPKDEAVLRVPRAHGNVETYHCPIDGTPMKRGKGPKSQYWLLE